MGLENFQRFFTGDRSLQIFWNTLCFAIFAVAGNVIVGLLLALALNRAMPDSQVTEFHAIAQVTQQSLTPYANGVAAPADFREGVAAYVRSHELKPETVPSLIALLNASADARAICALRSFGRRLTPSARVGVVRAMADTITDDRHT